MKITKPMVAELNEEWFDADGVEGVTKAFGISEERVYALFDWLEQAEEESKARGETELNCLRVFAKLLEAEVFSAQDLLLYAFKGFMYKVDMRRALSDMAEKTSLGGLLRRIAQASQEDE